MQQSEDRHFFEYSPDTIKMEVVCSECRVRDIIVTHKHEESLENGWQFFMAIFSLEIGPVAVFVCRSCWPPGFTMKDAFYRFMHNNNAAWMKWEVISK